MPIGISASATGAGPLVQATVAPFVRENLTVRGSIVQCESSGVANVSTDSRLRMRHLLAPDSTDSRDYRAAAKDANGLWTEWSPSVALATDNFTAGSTDVSIGSGATQSLEVDEPSVLFPDLSRGTGESYTYKTLVADGFADETRRPEWSDKITIFTVVMLDLDAYQVDLLQKFYSDLNGSFRPFFFIYTDPFSEEETKYVVRFRDNPTYDLLRVDRADYRWSLVEMPRTGGGGDV